MDPMEGCSRDLERFGSQVSEEELLKEDLLFYGSGRRGRSETGRRGRSEDWDSLICKFTLRKVYSFVFGLSNMGEDTFLMSVGG